ncbi:DUF305 domain-containing protein [Nonomuraea turkmeniaca]|uniref:DUF305 domain-containing protein n=1 Tax=Nonomuraea turkmeniaca TaxID=103838 RepID=A0A5S4F2F5_9ACTN|nr:DUF305 domain-containing protein [Nonomuraea turkmeniaca]TMR10178.1 DUF305 domain-containing protein [Nonomuraea turkmeniaca]
MRAKLVVAAALSGLMLISSGCGRSETSEAPVNADDVMFVQMMVRHHRQGIEIAKVGTARAAKREIKTLTAAIESTQQNEVEMMLRWLHSWDQPLTAPSTGHDHHGGMPETDVKQIQALKTSKSFERDLLNLLIAHQDDAVQMAGMEVYNGANPAVKEWAAQVQASRKGQIDMMTEWLKG